MKQWPFARQQLHKYAIAVELLLGRGLQVVLGAVISMSLLWCCITWPTELSAVRTLQCNAMQWSGASWLGEWLCELENCCSEAGSWATGTVQEPRGRGNLPLEFVNRQQLVKIQHAGKTVRYSELLSAWISNSRIITCKYDL
jgi:hypothetical protein